MFSTPSRKLEIFSQQFKDSGHAPVPSFDEEVGDAHGYSLRLISAKWSMYCHSQQRHVDSLRRRMPDPLVEINPFTANARGIEEADWVVIETSKGSIQARAKLNESLAEDVVCSQYGWWQDASGNYNNLISDGDFDPISGSNLLRNFRCNVFKTA